MKTNEALRNGHKITLTFVVDKLAVLRQKFTLKVKVISCPSLTLGTSNETADFVCDSIRSWWINIGLKRYPNAKVILVFCDSGGAESYKHHVFKEALQKLADKIELPVRICHYPPYASKWNPIEHKVFPHVTHSMSGVKLSSLDQAKNLIKNTTT
jgi:hypothetical protein